MTQRLRRKAGHLSLSGGMSLLRSTLAGAAAVLLLVSSVRGAGPQSGTASWYGPGTGVASQFCTWTLRHSEGCGFARITSLQTGLTIVSPVVDWCQCYRGTAQERIVDLQYGPLKALGLDPAQGLYPVTVEWLPSTGPMLPNTATKP